MVGGGGGEEGRGLVGLVTPLQLEVQVVRTGWLGSVGPEPIQLGGDWLTGGGEVPDPPLEPPPLDVLQIQQRGDGEGGVEGADGGGLPQESLQPP